MNKSTLKWGMACISIHKNIFGKQLSKSSKYLISTITLLTMGEEYFVHLAWPGISCKTDTFLLILWNSKHFSTLI